MRTLAVGIRHLVSLSTCHSRKENDMAGLNRHLKNKIDNILYEMQALVSRHFKINISPSEIQRILIPDEEMRNVLQKATLYVKPENIRENYLYKILSMSLHISFTPS